jgi:hypothetical protein
MDPDKRVFVSIYCKIYANSFSEKMINVMPPVPRFTIS